MRHEAIYKTHPNVIRVDDSLGAFDINGNQVSVNEAAVAEEIVKLQAAYDASLYRIKRASEYPPIGDQLDALFHAGVFPAEMAAKIQAVKDKYPK